MNSRRHRGARLTAGVALAFVASTALVACGSDSKDDSTSAAGDSTCVSTADTFMQDWTDLPTALPEGLEPLAEAPGDGYIINLAQAISPADLSGGESMEAAAELIGWDFKLITHDGTPEDVNAKFMEAMNEKPTAITIASIPP